MSRAIPKWEPIEGDLATPLGFRAAAVAAGIKKTHDALDLALIFSDSPATDGRRGFHHQSSCGGAGFAFTAKPGRKPGTLPRHRCQFRKCQCLHRKGGDARGGGNGPRHRRTVGNRTLPSSGGIDGSHWRPAQRGPYSSATPPSERKALQGERRKSRPSHHDH